MENDRESRSRGDAGAESAVTEKPPRNGGKNKGTEKAKSLNIAELKEMNISTLTKIAKDLAVAGATGMRKQELIFKILLRYFRPAHSLISRYFSKNFSAGS